MWKMIYLVLVALLFMSGCSEYTDISKDGVKISGQVTYDRVPSAISYGGIAKLDYEHTKKVSSKYIVVKAIDKDGKIIAQTTTDKDGKYSLYVPANIDVKIRAYARMYKKDFWDVSVVDNTNLKSLYVIEGEYHNTTNKHNIRDLHASSGWDGEGYSGTRNAAPFAILDSINQAMDKIRNADKKAKFPQLTVNWSINNVAAAGDVDSGQIITSNYDGARQLWILGDANSDTDEYDDHIIIHEWGHYFEDQFSRADNIGGSHSPGEALDIRVAFGEGWGNAFSGIATDNPIYFDTSGYQQSSGWYMDLENGAQQNPGWYSEGSVQRILYDLYDKTNESHDKTSLGFKPIYEVLVGAEKNTPAFTSIFSFIDALKKENSSQKRNIDKTVAYERINKIDDAYGSNRTNNANSQVATPVYKKLSIGHSITVCTRNNYGVYNKLGNRDFIKVKIDKDGTYKFDANSNNYGSDPDMILYETTYPHKDIAISSYEGSPSDTLIVNLKKGNYLLDVYDASFNNSCSTVTLRRNTNSYNKSTSQDKSVSKPNRARRLPKRQYY
ncbi:MAG: hypothetical protein GXO60_02985 [Epsilonproteobacteria bacterium]|nr:hypothetical protein [Campylobacterota bacterium]